MAQEFKYDFDRSSVCFAIYPDGMEGPRVVARITAEALADTFEVPENHDAVLDAYRENAASIDAEALKRYRSDPSGDIVIKRGEI